MQRGWEVDGDIRRPSLEHPHDVPALLTSCGAAIPTSLRCDRQCSTSVLRVAITDIRQASPRVQTALVFAPDNHPTRTSHPPVMLVTMTEYAQALAESRAAHWAYRRALLPTRTPRGESHPRTDAQNITELRRRVKAADAQLAAMRPESERSGVDAPDDLTSV